ncbi:MAG: hypothetical protein MI802_26645, partial [Desulfobacterales bacterium]|nr:hypothetical protein [Desulfobacterales bacterium]
MWDPAAPPPATAGESPGLVITPDLQFAYAAQLFAEGDYPTAQVEFKRFLHFFPDDSRRGEARFKTAAALYHTGQYHEAARRLNDFILADRPEDDFTREAYFLQADALLAMGNTGYAQLALQNYLKLTEDPAVRDRIYLKLAAIHMRESLSPGTDTLDQAARYLTLIRPESREESGAAYKLAVIDRIRTAPKKNPTTAGILAIIPGGGFLYCDRYKDAFVTFCLNTGLMYAAYEAFDSGNPALGGIISFVEAGFYAGNIYGSVSAAH